MSTTSPENVDPDDQFCRMVTLQAVPPVPGAPS